MSLLRLALVIPSFLVGVLVFHRIGAESHAEMTPPIPVISIPVPVAPAPETPAQTTVVKKKKKAQTAVAERMAADVIIERRLRIEGLLTHLDQVAAVAMQMKPEEADRLEPVIVDLAERTLELVDAEALAEPAADIELEDLEEALAKLMEAVTLQVQTETVL